MGRGCLPQPSLPAWPGCVCGLGGGEQCRGASTIPRPGSPPPQFARCGRSETCRIPRLPPEEAGGWVGGWGGSKLPSSERKPRSCEAPNGEVRKSGRPPLPRPPPTLAAPLSSRPQPPVPGQSLPYLPQQRRPRRRRLDPASCKSPGAPRVAGGQAGRPTRGGGGSSCRRRPRPAPGQAGRTPGCPSRLTQAPSPPPACWSPPGAGGSGCPGCRRCGARGPGPGQDAARPPVLPARRLRARSAGAAANAAPAAAACARRSLSGRRRSAPLACPALLAFFPLPEGGGEPSRAGGGAARGGGGGGRGRGEGGGERRAASPHRAAGAPQSLAL